MSFHLKRNLLIFATLMLIMQIAKSQDDPPPTESEEEDDSSSEETVEDSNEQRKRRRRRSVEVSDDSAEDPTKTNGNEQKVVRAIPGLPDPATLIKIAEILKAVGDQVIPILTAGNTGSMEFIANRISRDMKFLKSFKSEIDVLTDNLTKQN